MIAPRPSGYATTKAGKTAILERTKKLVDESAFIITVPFEGVSKEKTDLLKKMLPNDVKASVVKNKLMKMVSTQILLQNLCKKSLISHIHIYILLSLPLHMCVRV